MRAYRVPISNWRCSCQCAAAVIVAVCMRSGWRNGVSNTEADVCGGAYQWRRCHGSVNLECRALLALFPKCMRRKLISNFLANGEAHGPQYQPRVGRIMYAEIDCAALGAITLFVPRRVLQKQILRLVSYGGDKCGWRCS